MVMIKRNKYYITKKLKKKKIDSDRIFNLTDFRKMEMFYCQVNTGKKSWLQENMFLTWYNIFWVKKNLLDNILAVQY